MRFFVIGLVTAACSLVTLPAFAQAYVEITLPGNDGGSATIHTSDPAALSRVIVAAPDNPRMDTSSYTAAASDMTTGTMRCRVSAHLTDDNIVFPLCSSQLYDTITIHGPAGQVDVTLTLVADGTATASLAQSFHNIRAKWFADLFFQSLSDDSVLAETQAHSEYDYDADGGTFTSTVTDGGGVISTSLNSQTATIHARATLTVGVPVDIGAELDVNDSLCTGFDGDTLLMDFGNTARLSVDLPAGYTFTSDSDTLLTDPGGPGLGIPPDGGTGVTGLGDAGSTKDGGGPAADGGGDASIVGTDGGTSASLDGGSGSGDGATNDGSSDDGGCNSAGSTSDLGAVFALTGFALVVKRRRTRRSR